jgi:HNH endonuclease/NUMOD4 motif
LEKYIYSPTLEQWRPIAGWEGIYTISDHGRVFSSPRTVWRKDGDGMQAVRRAGKFLKPHDRNGYPSVGLKDGGRSERCYIHRLVCQTFNGPQPDGHEVAHNDGTRTNSHSVNLRWASRRDNMLDKPRHGTVFDRDRQPHAKIRSSDLQDIFKMFADDARNADVFRAYPISRSHVSYLRKLYSKVA